MSNLPEIPTGGLNTGSTRNPGGTSAAIDSAARLVGYRSSSRYRARARHLFSGIDLQGKDVLEVGCGAGAWAIWAALCGARSVLGIDPYAEGMVAGTKGAFAANITKLCLTARVEARSVGLTDLDGNRQFDVIILHNVINHLDEAAVARLHDSTEAVDRYMPHLRRLHELCRVQGLCIVADCSRYNLWHSLGLRSPVAPTIDWEIHQTPELWTELFDAAGFSLWDLRWSPLYPLGSLSSNRAVAFCTTSHFVLRFRRR